MKTIVIATAILLTSLSLSVRAKPKPQVMSSQSAGRKPGDIVMEKASVSSAKGEPIEVDLGTLYVPENRADPNSRIIGVGFARARALQPSNVPPSFHLPGGPGSSFINGLKAGGNPKHPLASGIDYYRFSDVVFIDQRGASERGDVLRFKYRTTEHPLDQPLSVDRDVAGFTDFTCKAVSEFTQRGFDLRGYSIIDLAEDVNDLRKALGYQQVTLVGQSFGSQWAFAVMRLHPEIVARALLSGVEPLDCGYDMPSQVFAVVQRMWSEAEQDPRIKPYLPTGGLMQVAHEIVQRLERESAHVTVKDPKSGEIKAVTLGPEDFRANFHTELSGPAFLLSLYYRHYDELAQLAVNFRRSHETEEAILGPLVDTSLGVTPRREYLLRRDPAANFLGQWNFNSYLATANIWPTADVGNDFRTEVLNRIPVVFVTGDWDTSTPIENTLAVAPYFMNGHVVIVEHGRHAVLKNIASSSPATLAALLEFVKSGSTEKLPVRITLPVPKFDVPAFPPPAVRPN
jgi:pimeloyl-ACP methyl ester carboxylesterase